MLAPRAVDVRLEVPAADHVPNWARECGVVHGKHEARGESAKSEALSKPDDHHQHGHTLRVGSGLGSGFGTGEIEGGGQSRSNRGGRVQAEDQ